MVVCNANRTTAIVIRHDGRNVRLVRMRSGRLAVSRCTRDKFDAEWHQYETPLDKEIAAFIKHAQRQGATTEVMKGLEALAARDILVIRSLF